MLRAWLSIVAVLLSVNAGQATLTIFEDHGGLIGEYIQRYQSADSVAIEGRCVSACTLALGLPRSRVCVKSGALLGFHSAFVFTAQGTRGATEPLGTAFLWNSYPRAVRQRLKKLTTDMQYLTGSELIRLGIRECPP